jgi:hypothetical protein
MITALQLLLWGTLYFLLAQIIWFIAVGILLYGLSQRDDVRSIKIVSLSMVFWSLNYILLWLTWALLVTLIWFVRMYFSLKYKGNMYAFSLLLALTWIAAIFSFEWDFISVLPIMSSVCGIVWFQLFSWIKMRIILLTWSMFWFVYVIAVNNIPGIINEVLVQMIMIITIIKMYLWEDQTMTIRQKIRFLISKKAKNIRPRIDFWSFLVVRDRKRFLNDEFNNIVYEDGSDELKTTL